MGIESVWKPGQKKKDLIEKALRKLNAIKQGVEDGKSREDIEKEIELKEAEAKEAEQKRLDEEERKKLDQEKVLGSPLIEYPHRK